MLFAERIRERGNTVSSRPFWTAFSFGLVLQLCIVVAGHFVPVIKDNVFAVGGIALSLIAGAVYAWLARGALRNDLVGGTVVGGLCAFVGIAVSVALTDVPAQILLFGTVSSAVAGLLGGFIGRLLRRPTVIAR